MEYSMGFYFNRGVRVTYSLTAPKLEGALGLSVSGVSSKDHKRIAREMAQHRGCKTSEIEIERYEEY